MDRDLDNTNYDRIPEVLPPDRSESIAKLAEALAKAQGSMKPAEKSKDNPFFKSKYADLPALWETARKSLADNGLSVIQTTDFDEKGTFITTILAHSSGEWISGRLKVKPIKDDPQGVGSAITYARRYTFAAIIGATAEDEDDDGNAASGNKVQVQNNAVRKERIEANEKRVRKPAAEDVSQEAIYPEDNPHFYVIQGVEIDGKRPDIAGKAITELTVKQVENALKPKAEPWLTVRDRVNLKAFNDSITPPPSKSKKSGLEEIRAERAANFDEDLPF